MQTDYVLQGVFFARIICASICGLVVGAERQKRTKSAGVRTHLMIAVASALMMIISKYGFLDIVTAVKGVSVDVSRVAAGIITGIGIFSGVIYMGKKGTATGVTTIAGVWVTVGLGMACGAGMYLLALESTLIVVFFQYALHSSRLTLVKRNVRLLIVFRLKGGWEEYREIAGQLEEQKIDIGQHRFEKKKEDEMELSCVVELDIHTDTEQIVKNLLEMPQVIKVEEI